MIPNGDFLLIGAGKIIPKGFMNTADFGKTSCSWSKIMNNKQVLVYGVLESTNDLRNFCMGRIHFKELLKYQKSIEIFHC